MRSVYRNYMLGQVSVISYMDISGNLCI